MSDAIGWRRTLSLREAGVYYALALLMAVLALAAAANGLPPYFSTGNLTNIAYQASLVGIMGVAMTIVLITGAFDLSVASVAALGAAVLIGLSPVIGFPMALVAALATGAAIGLVNGAIVNLIGINAFIVTLGTLTAVRGLVLVLTDGRSLMVEDPTVLAQMLAFERTRVPAFWPLLLVGMLVLAVGVGMLLRRRRRGRALRPGLLVGGGVMVLAALTAGPGFALPVTVAYLLVITAVAALALSRTVVGRRFYATGGNAEAARLSGIDVTAYKIGAFVLSGLAAGFAGALFASRLGAMNPTALQGTELTVIAAAILGGTSLFGGAGSVVKTVVGALILFTLTNGFNILNLGASYQGLVEGTVVIVAAAIYTVGGRRGATA
jgi:D-xylose transport system permease protein